MTRKKRVTDARADSKGTITHVKLSGNKQFTPVAAAINQAKKGQIEGAHVSRTAAGKEYLRSNPDDQKGNNLDELAES